MKAQNLFRNIIFAALFLIIAGNVPSAAQSNQPPVDQSKADQSKADQPPADQQPDYIQEIEKEFGVVTDPAIVTRVDNIRARLLAVIPQAKTDKRIITVKVLNDPMVNAFATPDGHVYIFKGLVDACETDDMLASVMAHELTHVFHKHHNRMGDRELKGMLIGLAAAAVSGQLEALMFGQMLAASMVETYGRAAEIDADKSGTIFMMEAGYDPLASLELITVLEQESIHEPELGGNYFTVHPDPEQRMETIRDVLVSHGVKVPESVYRVHLQMKLVVPLTETEATQLSEWKAELGVHKPEEKTSTHDRRKVEEVPEDQADSTPSIVMTEYLLSEKVFKGVNLPAGRVVGAIVIDEEPVFYLSEGSMENLKIRSDDIIMNLGQLFLDGLRSFDVEEGTLSVDPALIAKRHVIAATTVDDASLFGRSQTDVNKTRVSTLQTILWRYYVSRRI